MPSSRSDFDPDLSALIAKDWKQNCTQRKNVSTEFWSAKLQSFYNDLELPQPNVLVVDSPLAAQLAINHLFYNTPIDIQNPVEQVLYQRIIALEGFEATSPPQPINNQLWEFIGDRLARELTEKLTNQPTNTVRQALWKPLQLRYRDNGSALIELQVKAEMERRKLRYFTPALHGSWDDIGWAAFGDYYLRNGLIRHDLFQSWIEMLQAGCYQLIAYEKLVVVCLNPQIAAYNSQNQLWSEDGPAMRWADGYQLYYWNGIRVSEQLIERPETITRKDIMQVDNAEVRRCMQEALGSERFGSLLDLIELDADKDLRGAPQVLYRTREVDELAEDYLYFARVSCPSTERVYFLCVPPGLNNVWDAVAWTFGKTADTYRPQIET